MVEIISSTCSSGVDDSFSSARSNATSDKLSVSNKVPSKSKRIARIFVFPEEAAAHTLVVVTKEDDCVRVELEVT
jgi:hypothetical protein